MLTPRMQITLVNMVLAPLALIVIVDAPVLPVLLGACAAGLIVYVQQSRRDGRKTLEAQPKTLASKVEAPRPHVP